MNFVRFLSNIPQPHFHTKLCIILKTKIVLLLTKILLKYIITESKLNTNALLVGTRLNVMG